jgi:hypothetical protein
MPQQVKSAQPATASGVVRIVGPLEDDVVASIISTHATEAEVLEAVKWFTADDGLGSEVRRNCSGRVAQVYEILAAEAQDDDEPDLPVRMLV